MKLSHSVSGALRTFSYFMASGTHYYLEDIDYLSLYGENPSEVEMAYAIFANVLEFDAQGEVTNEDHATLRATQYIRHFLDRSYQVEPPFAGWETALH
ncbi:hypothetical protein QMK33_04160 [Hymenobacter sp. H14-R3]|uniref:DUF7677 family protein n=1 Tax=Hymenobacter sp. H14-R3 TaxID=3046308 RepID=UPI0024BBB615|nr:hypothetical protein [Hymenobacter sp. H14-R3]MDJ0364333.1 hypothetical protein [Hymenobacter sp. H14-R3]